ncbi:MAG: hypothetical protein PHI06_09570 [Desulfobulbaceae bacterium]|nr:hypothetical protein [Desulfobulbaceae bacterium]
MNGIIVPEPLRAGVKEFLPLLFFFFLWWIASRKVSKRMPPLPGEEGGQSHRQEENGMGAITPGAVLRQMLFGGMEMPTIRSPEIADEVLDESNKSSRTKKNARPQPATLSKQVLKESVDLPPQQELIRTPRAGKVSPLPAIQPKPARPLFSLAKASRHELQRAVIWSEILAPALGLRDDVR